MTRALLALLLVFPALAAACTDFAADAPCGSDQACAGRMVCAFGTCLDPLDQRLTTVDVEVDPGSAAAVPVQNLLGVDLSVTPRVDVELRPGVLLGGTVAAGGAPLSANVLLRPVLSIPGRALAPQTSTDGAGAFSLITIERARYAMTVTPTDPTRAPHYAYDDDPIEVRADDGIFQLDLVVLPDDGPRAHGRVIAGAGAASVGIPALAVHVERIDGRRLSSVATTDQDGVFNLALAAPVDDVVLVVSPTRENAYFPAIRLHGLTLAEGDTPLGDVELGTVLTPVPVLAMALDATGAGVPHARLALRAAVGNGLFSLAATADEQGGFDLLLPPASYDGVVLGGSDAPTAGMLLVGGLEVSTSPATPVMFRLPERLAVSGRVVAARGTPVADATLTLVRIGDVAGRSEEALEGTLVAFEAKADDRGRYQAAIDPGRYRLGVRPPPSSSAPPFSEIVNFDGGRATHDVSIPPRAVVAGTVLLGGAPQAGAYVRVFSALLDERGAAILIGEGTAGADGAFEIGVPDLLADVSNPNPP